ncbi:MAG: cobalamin-independent methionine synthase II family protein [Gemmataceae bacterium]|nr:cobalamin-independent methionine synthase II family protein [Gemmataceae bacterium]
MALPLIPATVIGSWSFPGWYAKLCADVAETPQLFGPADLAEAVDDAVRLAISDQRGAGLDIITDGEMQRVDFNLGFYQHLEGLQPLPRPRRWGPPAHDQRDRYLCVAPLRAPRGLQIVAEFQRLRSLLSAMLGVEPAEVTRCVAVKVPVPGPFTLAGCIQGGDVYRDREEITAALVPVVNQEMRALAAAGADFLQLDEPSFACHPDRPERFLDIIARTVAGVDAKISLHACFGNFRGRAVGWRSYRPVLRHLAQAPLQQLALEFASREMAEVELLASVPPPMEVAVGLVDVKNSWIEPPELVAERLRLVLRHLEPERVQVTPDCGFSQTARHVAVAKAKNMVEGVRLVRRELRASS